MFRTIVLLQCFLLMSCNSNETSNYNLDVQGHRGCRGLLPENTILGFTHALELGVTTLEMDVVISKDHQVVVSHEPYFSHEIAKDPEGNNISEAKEKSHNIYQLTYDEITAFDVGLRKHPRFPKQQKTAATKPKFREVVIASEKFSTESGRDLPYYNVEIKRVPENDELYHPNAFDFAFMVVSEVKKLGISERTIIQSFDPESLRMVRQIDDKLKLALLVENQVSPLTNLEKLGFRPAIYSPDYQLVDENLVAFCKEQGLQLIPWTVNDKAAMNRLLDLKVQGIITDYPNILIKLLEQKGINVK